jgi:hypothetical protein
MKNFLVLWIIFQLLTIWYIGWWLIYDCSNTTWVYADWYEMQKYTKWDMRKRAMIYPLILFLPNPDCEIESD